MGSTTNSPDDLFTYEQISEATRALWPDEEYTAEELAQAQAIERVFYEPYYLQALQDEMWRRGKERMDNATGENSFGEDAELLGEPVHFHYAFVTSSSLCVRVDTPIGRYEIRINC